MHRCVQFGIFQTNRSTQRSQHTQAKPPQRISCNRQLYYQQGPAATVSDRNFSTHREQVNLDFSSSSLTCTEKKIYFPVLTATRKSATTQTTLTLTQHRSKQLPYWTKFVPASKGQHHKRPFKFTAHSRVHYSACRICCDDIPIVRVLALRC